MSTVAWIGDSLAFRADEGSVNSRESITTGRLEDAGWLTAEIYWHGVGGKRINVADTSGTTTVQDLDAAKVALGTIDQAIIALGTNDVFMSDQQIIDAVNVVLDHCETIGVTEVIWRGIAYKAPDNPNAVRVNPLLQATVDARAFARYEDWASYIHDGRDETALWLADDGSHMTTSGYALWDEFGILSLADAVPEQGLPSPVAVYDFEEGTLGVAIPEGANGVIQTNGTTDPTYVASPFANHGTLGAETIGDGGGAIIYAAPSDKFTVSTYWDATLVSDASGAGRIVQALDGANSLVACVRRHNDGKIDIASHTNGRRAETVGTYAQGFQGRVDVQFTTTATRISVLVRIYPPESSDPYEQISITIPAPALATRFAVGPAIAGWTYQFDSVRAYDGLVWSEPVNPTTPPPPGMVSHLWAGSPTQDGFVVAAKTTAASSLRMAVSTDPAMAAPIYTSPLVPDADGYTRHVATGLTAGTQYYYQIEDTPTGGSPAMIGAIGKAKTLLPAGSPHSFDVALGSCTSTSKQDGSAHADITAWDPEFMVHLGDFYYAALTSTDPGAYEAKWADQIENYPSHAALCRDVPMFYAVSDHEAGLDNEDSDTAWHATMRDAYAQVVPHAGAAPTTLYHSWVVGRVRFIMLDIRNPDRSPGLDPDTASKTMLGATQKSWLKDRLLEPEPLKIILSDVAWMGEPSLSNAEDKWWAYATERQEIIDFIAANQLAVEVWHGDSHTIAYADKNDNLYGGFAVLCGAPLANGGGGRELDQFTFHYNVAESRQYLRISFADDGQTITRTAVGRDATTGVSRFTSVETYNAVVTWEEDFEDVPLGQSPTVDNTNFTDIQGTAANMTAVAGIHGSRGLQIVADAWARGEINRWDGFARGYARIDAFGVGNLIINRVASAGANKAGLKLFDTGEIGMLEENTAVGDASLRKFSIGEVFRWEWRVDPDTQELRLFYADNTEGDVPNETLTGSAVGGTPNAGDNYTHGVQAAQPGWTVLHDSLALGSAYPGPISILPGPTPVSGLHFAEWDGVTWTPLKVSDWDGTSFTDLEIVEIL